MSIEKWSFSQSVLNGRPLQIRRNTVNGQDDSVQAWMSSFLVVPFLTPSLTTPFVATTLKHLPHIRRNLPTQHVKSVARFDASTSWFRWLSETQDDDGGGKDSEQIHGGVVIFLSLSGSSLRHSDWFLVRLSLEFFSLLIFSFFEDDLSRYCHTFSNHSVSVQSCDDDTVPITEGK